MNPRRIWLVLAIVGASFAGGTVVNVGKAQSPRLSTDVLQAQAFVLTARDGRARAVLNVSPDGVVALALHDAGGRQRLGLRTDAQGGSRVVMYDEAGTERMSLALTDLILRDGDGRVRSWLRTDPDGSPSLVLLDENQKGRAVLGCAKLADPRTDIANDRAESSLILLDERQRIVMEAP